jgi:hypothetical protein
MTHWDAFAFNLVSITILVFGIYFPRHRRKDLVAALLGINVGVLAVTTALASAQASLGLGLGLFAVLSIIRLRSLELGQQEVAYYFVSLALGVLGGVPIDPDWLTPALMVALLAAMYMGDHPRLFARYRLQSITLDHAYPDRPALIARIEELLAAKVDIVTVRDLNLVNDTTRVDVRFREPMRGGDAR